jgi:hypothetical protein
METFLKTEDHGGKEDEGERFLNLNFLILGAVLNN